MANAVIYCPSKNAMQSNNTKLRPWVIELTDEGMQHSFREIDPLMGWTSNSNTRSQLSLRFKTSEEAEAYATRHEISYRIQLPNQSSAPRRSYASNFTDPQA